MSNIYNLYNSCTLPNGHMHIQIIPDNPSQKMTMEDVDHVRFLFDGTLRVLETRAAQQGKNGPESNTLKDSEASDLTPDSMPKSNTPQEPKP
jgi:hypothetical protein